MSANDLSSTIPKYLKNNNTSGKTYKKIEINIDVNIEKLNSLKIEKKININKKTPINSNKIKLRSPKSL